MRNLLSFHRSPPEPEPPFTPGANTLVYFPFESDALDHSGNGHTLGTSGTQETIGRRFNTITKYTTTINQLANFISFWMKIYNYGSGGSEVANTVEIFPSTGYLNYVSYNGWLSTTAPQDKIRFVYNSSWNEYGYKINSSIGQRYHIVMCYSNPGGAWLFVNGEKHQLTTNTTAISASLPISGYNFMDNSSTTKMDVALSDCIAETTARSDADVIAYFNATKSKYGVS